MSETVKPQENLDIPTKWDSLANLSNESLSEDLSLDFEDITLEDIDGLETKLNGLLASNTEEIHQYQEKIAEIRKRQALISNILHELAELKQLTEAENEFPFKSKQQTEPKPAVRKIPVEVPEEPSAEPTDPDLDKITDWYNWDGMSKDDWSRYQAQSRVHDAENLANLEKRDPELAKTIRESLEKRGEKVIESVKNEDAKNDTVENDTVGKERTFSEFDLYPRMKGESSREYGDRLKRMHEMTNGYLKTEAEEPSAEEKEAEINKLNEQIKNLDEGIAAKEQELAKYQEPEVKPYFVGDDKEAMSKILPQVDSVHMPKYEFLKPKLAEQKLPELNEMIRRNYAIIGGQRAMSLFGAAFEDQSARPTEYDERWNSWWNELSEEGRNKVAEIVKFAEENEIPESSPNSPINSAFLAWYYANLQRNR